MFSEKIIKIGTRVVAQALVIAAITWVGMWFVLDRALDSQDSNISGISTDLQSINSTLQNLNNNDGVHSEAITSLKNQQTQLVSAANETSEKLQVISTALKAQSEKDLKYFSSLGVSNRKGLWPNYDAIKNTQRSTQDLISRSKEITSSLYQAERRLFVRVSESIMQQELLKNIEYFGKDHLISITTLANLALIKYTTERYDEAEILLREALSLSVNTAGPNSLVAAKHMRSLAEVLEIVGKVKEAESLFERSASIIESNPKK